MNNYIYIYMYNCIYNKMHVYTGVENKMNWMKGNEWNWSEEWAKRVMNENEMSWLKWKSKVKRKKINVEMKNEGQVLGIFLYQFIFNSSVLHHIFIFFSPQLFCRRFISLFIRWFRIRFHFNSSSFSSNFPSFYWFSQKSGFWDENGHFSLRKLVLNWRIKGTPFGVSQIVGDKRDLKFF